MVWNAHGWKKGYAWMKDNEPSLVIHEFLWRAPSLSATEIGGFFSPNKPVHLKAFEDYLSAGRSMQRYDELVFHTMCNLHVQNNFKHTFLLSSLSEVPSFDHHGYALPGWAVSMSSYQQTRTLMVMALVKGKCE